MKKIISILLTLSLCIGLASCGMYEPNGDYNNSLESLLGSSMNNEKYNEIIENEFISTSIEATKAFSLKVDTAAYTNISRYIKNGSLPPVNAIRTEELINYFDYEMPMETNEDHPFSVSTQVSRSPFAEGKYMAYIRIKTPEIAKENLPPSNLTFLIDTSGSMYSYDKLPLVISAFSLLVENLTENDIVSIVTYAGSSYVALDSVSGNRKDIIMDAINSLTAGGSTAGAKGIETAYALAKKNYIEGGNNRVILATDGDFNVGISSTKALENFISEKRNDGIYLSCLGFGTGNLRDDMMETLSEHGNGNYSYIDSLFTAQKVLVDEMGSNLFTVAKDVKAELQFNTATVSKFRLIGYENRIMSSEEFDDSNKDAGEIGAGTDIVVMVELILSEDYTEGSLFDVCIRYKDPETDVQGQAIHQTSTITERPDTDYNFACAVAAFAEILRGSDYVDDTTADDIYRFANENKGKDLKGYRANFVLLVAEYLKMGLHTEA